MREEYQIIHRYHHPIDKPKTDLQCMKLLTHSLCPHHFVPYITWFYSSPPCMDKGPRSVVSCTGVFFLYSPAFLLLCITCIPLSSLHMYWQTVYVLMIVQMSQELWISQSVLCSNWISHWQRNLTKTADIGFWQHARTMENVWVTIGSSFV